MLDLYINCVTLLSRLIPFSDWSSRIFQTLSTVFFLGVYVSVRACVWDVSEASVAVSRGWWCVTVRETEQLGAEKCWILHPCMTACRLISRIRRKKTTANDPWELSLARKLARRNCKRWQLKLAVSFASKKRAVRSWRRGRLKRGKNGEREGGRGFAHSSLRRAFSLDHHQATRNSQESCPAFS